MRFEDAFDIWLNAALDGAIPSAVSAFCFNLWQPSDAPGVTYAVELIGAGRFDEADPDWPCDEVWEAEPRWLVIPTEYSGVSWQECLGKVKTLVKARLAADTPASRKLTSVQAVAIGFVDGDLEVLWKAET
jgi:hypothetical protein